MDFLLNSAEHHWSTLMTLVCRLTSNSPSYMRSVVLTCFYFSLGWSLLSTGAPRYIEVHSEKNDHTKRPLITSVACVFVFTDGHYQKNKILILWASVIEKKKKSIFSSHLPGFSSGGDTWLLYVSFYLTEHCNCGTVHYSLSLSGWKRSMLCAPGLRERDTRSRFGALHLFPQCSFWRGHSPTDSSVQAIGVCPLSLGHMVPY